MPRSFRTNESFAAEQITRDMLPSFLRERGFTDIKDNRRSFGRTQSQVLEAADPTGRQLSLWVRLCWRQGDRRKGKRHFSAAQLLARVKDGDWLGTIKRKIRGVRDQGVTHLLLVQRYMNNIRYAAAVPLDAIVPVWKKQRDISNKLIRSGALGRRTKNHAMNGASPTLWLQHDQAPSVAAALWTYPQVRDLAKIPPHRPATPAESTNDSVDDLPGLNYSLLGSDTPARVQIITSGVTRDDRVRKRVLQRSNGVCERQGCGARREYSGFLDVHHILGAENSDRVWNCVALCPNCHREAHTAPHRDQINAELLGFASKYGAGATKRASRVSASLR
jgi:5-methylcytosine-specific restriction protein A